MRRSPLTCCGGCAVGASVRSGRCSRSGIGFGGGARGGKGRISSAFCCCTPAFRYRIPARLVPHRIARKGAPMKTATFSAVALSVAVLGFAAAAQAQEARKLFIEGDIVRGNTPLGATGPI